MKENGEQLAIMEEKIGNITKDIEEMKKSIEALLEWAEAVYQYETVNHKIYFRLVTSEQENNEIGKEGSMGNVES